MSVGPCCGKGFLWEGTPTGTIGTLGANQAYITGTNPEVAVLIVPDLFGWAFPNIRLLADHYAREADATVYVPDFFSSEALPTEPLVKGRYDEIDLAGFVERNGRERREPEILACARALRTRGYHRVAAVGFCYGAWAAMRLGSRAYSDEGGEGGEGGDASASVSVSVSASPRLVDCVVVGHPSMLIKQDIDELAAPVLVLAPEFDHIYTPELKTHTFETLQKNRVPFEFRFFPGVHHACMVRGDEEQPGEREAMIKGKEAAVAWLAQHLH